MNDGSHRVIPAEVITTKGKQLDEARHAYYHLDHGSEAAILSSAVEAKHKFLLDALKQRGGGKGLDGFAILVLEKVWLCSCDSMHALAGFAKTLCLSSCLIAFWKACHAPGVNIVVKSGTRDRREIE